MYIKKSMVLMLLLINLSLLGYILVDNKVIFASNEPESNLLMMDLQSSAEPAENAPRRVEPAATAGWQTFEATAYCNYGITRTGVWVQRGIVAVDPAIIPLGSIVEIRSGKYSGFYTAMDTGAMIKGTAIDIYVPSTQEAVEYGRRPVRLNIIRRGWNPGHPADETLAQGISPIH